MKKCVGVWIDHRKAVIVTIKDGAEEIHSVVSGVEKHVRYSGGMPEDQQEHRFTNHLNEFYASIISHLHDADSILLLGPGEAKVEFKTRLESNALGDRVDGIETVDKLTDRQIAAKVREHFPQPQTEIVQTHDQ
jgi:stalled ribosome rescue protein Dom34